MNKPGNFFDDEHDGTGKLALSYADGFRFGLGFIAASVVAFLVIGVVAFILSHVFKLF